MVWGGSKCSVSLNKTHSFMCEIQNSIQCAAAIAPAHRWPLLPGFTMYFNRQFDRWALFHAHKYVKGSAAKLAEYGGHRGLDVSLNTCRIESNMFRLACHPCATSIEIKATCRGT